MDKIAHADRVMDQSSAAKPALRIAFVTETYPPEVNGVALTMARVVQGLHRRGHHVQLVRPQQGPGQPAAPVARFEEVLVRGLPIPRYPHLRMGMPCKRALLRYWTQQPPDVVHIATEGPLGWSALRAARQLKLPVSSDFRTNFHAYSAHYRLGWLGKPIMAYLRHFHNHTHCTMVPTEALRRDLHEFGYRRLQVVSRGVDTAQFGPHRRSELLRRLWGAGPQDLVVISVGRLAAEKNLELLLSAFEAIQLSDTRARLVIVGDGPLRDAMRARCPQALFAGQRSGDDLAAHYASADLFLFPSLTETFGNVTAEAMASGLPVLAFDYAAASQLICSGRNGMLVPFGDAATFVRYAADLANAMPWLRKMGEGARAGASDLGWDSVLVRFESVLSMLIRQAPLGPAEVFAALRQPAA